MARATTRDRDGTVTLDGNVLTSAIEPYGRPMTGGGQGFIGGPANPYGTYQVHPDGTVSVTLDPDNPLPEGQQHRQDVVYRAVGPEGDIGVGAMFVTLIGRG
jgi:hypothetical protein